MDRLPRFVLTLANDVDWDASIGDCYALYPPLLPNPSGEGLKFYQISKSKCSIEQPIANEQRNIDQETPANETNIDQELLAEEICSAIQQAMITYGPNFSSIQFQGLEKKMVRKPYAGVGAGAGAGAALGMLTGFTAPITMPVMATFAALLGTTPGQSMVDNADSLSYSDSERGQHKDTQHALAVSRSTYVTFSGGTGHLKHEYLFGSVGDDCHLLIWDMRTPAPNKPQQSVVAHQSEVNSLAFNPFNEWLLRK